VASISQKIKKIDYALYHDPSLLPAVVKDCSISRGLINSRFNRVLPRRVGIEFELEGRLMSNYQVLHPELKTDLSVERHFGIHKFSEDDFDGRPMTEVERIPITHLTDPTSRLNEVRISLTNAYQLKGLAKLMTEMKRYCLIPDGGGIHIHVDFTKYASKDNIKIAIGYISKRLDEVASIFPEYTGTYNNKKVGDHQKATWVNFSYHNTIEFRIAPLTFEYEILLDWIIKVNKFVSKLIDRCHLKPIAKSVSSNYLTDEGITDSVTMNTQLDALETELCSNEVLSYYTINNNQTWMTYNVDQNTGLTNGYMTNWYS
jgi:hypothetical protein